jgi:hypothetical protein
MHNIRLADPLNEFARELKSITSKRKKTDEDHADMARVEFMGGIYWTEQLGPYLPAENILRTIQDGAKLSKQGKSVERGLIVLDDAPLLYAGPRDREGLFADARFVDRRPVSIGQAKTVRTRPCFREWVAEVEAEVLTEVLDLDILARVTEDAGRYTGVGDYRPRFGRFDASVEVAG